MHSLLKFLLTVLGQRPKYLDISILLEDDGDTLFMETLLLAINVVSSIRLFNEFLFKLFTLISGSTGAGFLIIVLLSKEECYISFCVIYWFEKFKNCSLIFCSVIFCLNFRFSEPVKYFFEDIGFH